MSTARYLANRLPRLLTMPDYIAISKMMEKQSNQRSAMGATSVDMSIWVRSLKLPIHGQEMCPQSITDTPGRLGPPLHGCPSSIIDTARCFVPLKSELCPDSRELFGRTGPIYGHQRSRTFPCTRESTER